MFCLPSKPDLCFSHNKVFILTATYAAIVYLLSGGKKTLEKKVFAIAMLLLLTVAVLPAHAAMTEGPLHFTKLVVDPDGPGLNFTVYYEMDFFTTIFSMIFGGRSLQPSVEGLFMNYSDVSLVSMNVPSGSAKVVARNQSRLSEDWYVYDNDTAFSSNIPHIEINIANETKSYTNMNRLPIFCYRVV